MKGWPKTLTFALACFVLATLSMATALYQLQGERQEHTYTAAPLPPPGSSTSFWFRPDRYWRRYALELKTSVPPASKGARRKLTSPPCDIEIRFVREGQVRYQTTLRNAEDTVFDDGTVADFTTEVFEFAPGGVDVEVTNAACDEGYEFTGGVLQMERMSPVMFSRGTLPLIAALLLSALGIIATIAGGLLAIKARPRPGATCR
ncbi:MAG: hypothetical protein AAGA34_09005 [Pseudomonadota bacterium]